MRVDSGGKAKVCIRTNAQTASALSGNSIIEGEEEEAEDGEEEDRGEKGIINI